MNNKIPNIGKYCSWIFKQYKEIRSELKNAPAYNIQGIIKTNNGIKIKTYITGTGKIVKWFAREIAADNNLLEGFLKKDIRTIIYYACVELNEPQYKIISYNFSTQLNQIVFKFQNKKLKIIQKTANEALMDKNFLNKFSKEDVSKITYIYGIEQTEMENELIKNI